jgi:dihydroflavonol-4-reductase
MIKVLVTGANGLLATNTIIALIENGYSVVALVRNRFKFPLPGSADLEIREGDISDTATIENAMHGCEYVVHAAAETSQGLRDYNHYQKINVSGTKNVFETAIRNKVKRIIHVSTANVFGYGTFQNPGDESLANRQPFLNSLYVRSKIEAQKIALSYSAKTEVIIVNPTFLIGPWDQKPSSGRVIILVYNKRVIFYPPGGKNIIHVSDAASGIVKALTKGASGESYLLANTNLTYKEIFEKISAHSGKKPLFVRIPQFILLAIGVAGNVLMKLGFNTEFTLTNMRILCVENYYSGKKAEKEFGIVFRPVEVALDDAISWFKLNNKLSQK